MQCSLTRGYHMAMEAMSFRKVAEDNEVGIRRVRENEGM